MVAGPKAYSQLDPLPSGLSGTELLGVTQAGHTYRATAQQIADLASTDPGGGIDELRLTDLETARVLGRVFYPEGFNRTTGAVVALNSGLGAQVGGSVDCLASFNAARDAAAAVGGGIIECDVGIYGLSNDFTIGVSGVRLVGKFSVGMYWSTAGVGTVLKRIGATAGDAVVRVVTPTGATAAIVGNSVENLIIDGGGVATGCIHTRSVQHGLYRNLFLRGATSYLGWFDSGTYAGGGQVSCNQDNIIEDIVGTTNDAKAADGIIFDGISPFAPGQGNFSINNINRISIQHSDGVAFKLNNIDSNVFRNLSMPRTGSGTLTGFSTNPSSDSYFHKNNHGFVENDQVTPSGLSNTGGVTNGTKYYVIATGLDANKFAISATMGGPQITFSGGVDNAVTFTRAGRGIGMELNASMISGGGYARASLFEHVDAGPGGIVVRGTVPINNAVTHGTTAVESSNFTSAMVGQGISGPDIQAGTTISSVTPGVSAVLSLAATGSHTGLTLRVEAIAPSSKCFISSISWENIGSGPTYGLGFTDVVTIEPGARLWYTEDTGQAHFKSLELGPTGTGNDSYPTITPVSGAPEGNLIAPIGSLALRVDTDARGVLHVKGSGVGDTGWKSVHVENLATVSGNNGAITTTTTLIDASGGNRTWTLPSAVGAISGKIFRIKKVDSTKNTVTIARTSSQTIDDVDADFVLRDKNHVVVLQSDGANWTILHSNVKDGLADTQIVYVTGSDATATQTQIDITGLVVPLLAGLSYEYRAKLKVATSADTNGNQYGPAFTGTLGPGGAETFAKGMSSASGIVQGLIAGVGTLISNNYLTISSLEGLLVVEGFIAVATAGNFSLQHKHGTAGTSTVRVGSFLEMRRLNT